MAEPIEFELFTFGYSGSITLSRKTAQKAAESRIGTQSGSYDRLVTITAIRLENDTPDGSKGRVIAFCEPVQQLEQIEPRHPKEMETS